MLWFSDIITNAAILMRPDLAGAAWDQILELAKGQRAELSTEVRGLSCLPPVVIGVLAQSGAWRVELARIAREINVPVDKLEKAWDGFFAQLEYVGKRSLERELLTTDYVADLPPPLLIGLPGLVLLQLVMRSPKGDDKVLVLHDGTRLDASSRPRGAFADETWAKLLEAKRAHAAPWRAARCPPHSRSSRRCSSRAARPLRICPPPSWRPAPRASCP